MILRRSGTACANWWKGRATRPSLPNPASRRSTWPLRDGARGSEEGQPIPDVLPTSGDQAEAAAPGADGEERDDELARLQRLLGMVGGAPVVGGEDAKEPPPEVEEVSLEAEADAEAAADEKVDQEEED